MDVRTNFVLNRKKKWILTYVHLVQILVFVDYLIKFLRIIVDVLHKRSVTFYRFIRSLIFI